MEDEAADLFLRGVSLEKHGRLYDAIGFYRPAVRLVPDIERCLPVMVESTATADEDFDLPVIGCNVEELCGRFQQMGRTHICFPEHEQHSTHISALPPEVLLIIFHWAVGDLLDLRVELRGCAVIALLRAVQAAPTQLLLTQWRLPPRSIYRPPRNEQRRYCFGVASSRCGT